MVQNNSILNRHYLELKDSYLFSEITRKVAEYSAKNPEANLVRMGIGDVTLPLSAPVVDAMRNACAEMGQAETFRGYAPELGYSFIREAVAEYYAAEGISLSPDEIFVSDGAKCDMANLTDIFGDVEALIPDPVYPVYYDSNVMAGRRIGLLRGTEENNFLPMPDGQPEKPYVIYLCSPNNPTGAVYTAAQLAEWVDFANKTGSVIIFDSAYQAFIRGDFPHSIFALPNARTCAIEVSSLSKTAGFTGTRCGWTIVPSELEIEGLSLKTMWARRQTTKFNGVPYIIQRGAEAALSPAGMAECRKAIDYYLGNARIISTLLDETGIRYTGGSSSPYIWFKCPGGMSSWQYFDYLLENIQVIGTPGCGFGECGEGWFRLTSFASREATEEAAARLRRVLE